MSYQQEIAFEQQQINRTYQVLDETRTNYRHRQAEVERGGPTGSPQNRSERDALAAYYGDQASRLAQVEDRLVFGRLTEQTGLHRYIGRVGLYAPNGEQLLIDWRAQAATPFYQATAFSPLGMKLRRQIGLHNRTVVSIEDELLDLSAAEDSDLILQGEGALLAALTAGRSGRMHDIVATIQAEQDRVIRSTADQVLVVQGGPGTGKTAVALHRAAFLLYDRAERLAKSGVLIVGPSPTFLRYIEQVLPALGETGVVSTTIERLLPGIVADEAVDTPEVARLKGDLRWVAISRQLVASLQRIPAQSIWLSVDGFRLELSPALVKAAQRQARAADLPHNEAREIFVRYVLQGLTDQYLAAESKQMDTSWEALGGADLFADSEGTNQSNSSEDNRAFIYELIRNDKNVRREINLCWMPYTAEDLLARFYRLPQLRAKFGKFLSPAEQALLQRTETGFSRSDVAILDELAELLGHFEPAQERRQRLLAKRRAEEEQSLAADALSRQGLGNGLVSAALLAQRAHGETGRSGFLAEQAMQDRTWVFGHVVVDEAQELSPLEWRILLRRCPSRSFTVVGDLAQSVGPVSDSWRTLLGPLAPGLQEEVCLTVCYRTPQEIMDLAERVAAAGGRPSPFPVRAVRSDPDSVRSLQVSVLSAPEIVSLALSEARWLDKEIGVDSGRIAIIAPEAWLPLLRSALGSNGDPIADRISVLSAQTAKGLEFDSVVVVDPAEIAQISVGNLFVALTRPTRHLVAVSTGNWPAGWQANN